MRPRLIPDFQKLHVPAFPSASPSLLSASVDAPVNDPRATTNQDTNHEANLDAPLSPSAAIACRDRRNPGEEAACAERMRHQVEQVRRLQRQRNLAEARRCEQQSQAAMQGMQTCRRADPDRPDRGETSSPERLLSPSMDPPSGIQQPPSKQSPSMSRPRPGPKPTKSSPSAHSPPDETIETLFESVHTSSPIRIRLPVRIRKRASRTSLSSTRSSSPTNKLRSIASSIGLCNASSDFL